MYIIILFIFLKCNKQNFFVLTVNQIVTTNITFQFIAVKHTQRYKLHYFLHEYLNNSTFQPCPHVKAATSCLFF